MEAVAVKEAARGRWDEILPGVGGIDSAILDGNHHACPKCGGTDRFRMIDAEAGALFCNQCFREKNGDGIAALQWLTGLDFPTTIARTADYLGLKNGKPSSNGELPPWERPIAAVYQYHDGQDVRYEIVRFADKKEFRVRVPTGGGRYSWSLKKSGVTKILYRLPDIISNPDQPIFIVEGEKDADSLHQKCNVVATTNTFGAESKWLKSYSDSLKGRKIIILPDNDTPGRKHAESVAASVCSVAECVKIVDLPGLQPKGDVSDWLAAGGTAEQLMDLVEAAPEWRPSDTPKGSPRPDDDRIPVQVTMDEHLVNAAALDALKSDDTIYQRGGSLAHVVPSAGGESMGVTRAVNVPTISPLPVDMLREKLTATAWFFVRNNDEEDNDEQVRPPSWCVKAIHSRGYWPGIRPLNGVATSPILRADGSICSTPGYDSSTGLFYEPGQDFPEIPHKPTKDVARKALAKLLEVFADFPYATEAHRASCLASLFTSVGRQAFEGPAPLFLFDANVRGSGKTLQADCVSLISTGREIARMSNPKDDDEARKRITAIALFADPIVLIDNIGGALGSPSLDAALTATVWKDRILGKSEIVELPLRTVWLASGNNTILQADTSRRVVHIRLDSREENPEERTGFTYPDLRAHVRKHRADLLAATLTIFRAFFDAGCPKANLKPWGSFEAWSDLVRQAIVWLDLPDPGETRQELVLQSDREAGALRALITGWQEIDPDSQGLTAAQAVKILDDRDNAHRYETLRSAVAELCSPKNLARSLGTKLGHLRGRVVGGCYFQRRTESHAAVWYLAKVSEGCQGSKGCLPDPLRERESFSPNTYAHAHAKGAGNHPQHAQHPEERTNGDSAPGATGLPRGAGGA